MISRQLELQERSTSPRPPDAADHKEPTVPATEVRPCDSCGEMRKTTNFSRGDESQWLCAACQLTNGGLAFGARQKQKRLNATSALKPQPVFRRQNSDKQLRSRLSVFSDDDSEHRSNIGRERRRGRCKTNNNDAGLASNSMEPSHSVKSTAVPPVVYQELPLNAEAWLPPMLTAARRREEQSSCGRILRILAVLARGAPSAAKGKARRKITVAELEKHSSEDNAWMAVHGLVLNLSKDFLDEHPGGPDVVTALAGKDRNAHDPRQDGTQDFEDISHSDSARDWASKLIIGYMESAADEEGIQTKLVPKHAEAAAKSGAAGGLGAFGKYEGIFRDEPPPICAMEAKEVLTSVKEPKAGERKKAPEKPGSAELSDGEGVKAWNVPICRGSSWSWARRGTLSVQWSVASEARWTSACWSSFLVESLGGSRRSRSASTSTPYPNTSIRRSTEVPARLLSDETFSGQPAQFGAARAAGIFGFNWGSRVKSLVTLLNPPSEQPHQELWLGDEGTVVGPSVVKGKLAVRFDNGIGEWSIWPCLICKTEAYEETIQEKVQGFARGDRVRSLGQVFGSRSFDETRLAVAEGEEGTVADLSATCQLGIWPGDRELMRSDLVMPLARSWCTSTLTIGSGVWIRNSWNLHRAAYNEYWTSCAWRFLLWVRPVPVRLQNFTHFHPLLHSLPFKAAICHFNARKMGKLILACLALNT
eukprot:s5862_g6.t1